MKPNKPENQPAQSQIVVSQEDELDEAELDAINGGLIVTSTKGKDQKPQVVIAIIAILIG